MFGGLTGKVLGIARELIAASLLGTGLLASAFRLAQAAFFIPVQGFISEGLASGFAPAYSRSRVRGPTEGRTLFAGMHAIVLVVSLILGALLVVFARNWVKLLAPGFDEKTATLATHMVQCFAFAMPFCSLTSLYAAAELSAGRAAMAAARATAQSLGLILGTVLAWWLGMPLLIPFGFVLAYFGLAVWGARSVRAIDLRLWPGRGEWKATLHSLADVWSAYKILVWIPALIQVHYIVERRVASVDNLHAVAALDYAKFVADTAVLLLAMPFALAGLATMAAVEEAEFRTAAGLSLRLLLFMGFPLSVALVSHPDWAVRLAYGRGAFGAESVATTTAILRTMAFGLWAQLLGYAGTRFLNARGKNHSVLGIYAVAVLANIVLNLILQPLVGVAGLGIAASVNNAIVAVAVLVRLDLWRYLAKDAVGLIAACVGYVLLWHALPAWISGSVWVPPIWFVAYWGILYGVVPRYRSAVIESFRLIRFTK